MLKKAFYLASACIAAGEAPSAASTEEQFEKPKKAADVNRRHAALACCIREACLRIGDVASITGLSVPTIYREIAHGRFPAPFKLTAGVRAWKLSEVMGWIDTRERDGSEPNSAETGASASKCPRPDGRYQLEDRGGKWP